MDGYGRGFSRCLNGLGQLVVLSILWTVCCLPVVTIGASSAALYYTAVKVVRRGRGSLLSSFFSCFRDCFWQSLHVNMFYLAAFAVLAFFALPYLDGEDSAGGPVPYLLLGLAFLLLLPCVFSYPAISRFYHRGTALARFLLLLAGRHVHVGIACALLLLACGALALSNGAALLLAPGLCAFLQSLLLEPVFRRYSDPSDREGCALWYGGDPDGPD